jgi:hypothetical protein
MADLSARDDLVDRSDDDATDAPAPAHPATGPAVDDGPELTVGEAGGLVLAVAVAMVATASLALAEVGRHDGWLALGLGLAVTGLLTAAMWLSGPRPVVRVDRVEIGLVAVAGVAAAFFFLPGFPYASADKDPGVYVAHAFAIAREGDVSIPDEVLARGIDPNIDQGIRFPGLWLDPTDPDVVTPQFYHLYPATLATADDLVGSSGVFNTSPVLAVMSVCLLAIAARRASGTAVAIVFAALLITSMMQVWQAKYPSTEILAQFLLAGSLLGGVLAVERRWAGGAFAAGVLLTVGFLARPDGFLYILLATAVIGMVIAVDRFDRRTVALGLGLALPFPYAAWNAYELRVQYSATNSVPSLATLVGACALAVLAGVAVRGLVVLVGGRRGRGGGGGAPDREEDRAGARAPGVDLLELVARWQVPLGVLFGLAFGLVLLALWHREDLLGTDYVYSHFQQATIPSLDELNIKWLSWFLTMRGLVVVWLGLVVVAVTRPRASLYLLLLPGVVLLPVYLWDARISMRLMWWVRRFVPAVLPALMLLVAIAIAWALLHRFRPLRVIGALVAVAFVVEFASQSLPLRDHQEMAGSWQAAEAVADVAGDEQGVFLFTAPDSTIDPMRNVPGIVWFVFDQIAARLPADVDIDEIERYADAFPGQPVFVVTHGELPSGLPAERFAPGGTVTQQLTVWEESTSERPDEAFVVRADLAFWRLTS